MAEDKPKKRDKYPTRTILLKSEVDRNRALATLNIAPIDLGKPLEFILREEVKKRKLDQNSLMWVGPLKDIAEQAYVEGRTYSDVIWHEHFKTLYLPEEYDPELCKDENYKKWDFKPNGDRILVGSTTELTVKGFAQYLEQVMADGANMGVQYHANPNEAMPGWVR